MTRTSAKLLTATTSKWSLIALKDTASFFVFRALDVSLLRSNASPSAMTKYVLTCTKTANTHHHDHHHPALTYTYSITIRSLPVLIALQAAYCMVWSNQAGLRTEKCPTACGASVQVFVCFAGQNFETFKNAVGIGTHTHALGCTDRLGHTPFAYRTSHVLTCNRELCFNAFSWSFRAIGRRSWGDDDCVWWNRSEPRNGYTYT